jgi:hypothetical protein
LRKPRRKKAINSSCPLELNIRIGLAQSRRMARISCAAAAAAVAADGRRLLFTPLSYHPTRHHVHKVQPRRPSAATAAAAAAHEIRAMRLDRVRCRSDPVRSDGTRCPKPLNEILIPLPSFSPNGRSHTCSYDLVSLLPPVSSFHFPRSRTYVVTSPILRTGGTSQV